MRSRRGAATKCIEVLKERNDGRKSMFETMPKQWQPKVGEGESEDDTVTVQTERMFAQTKNKQEKNYNTRLYDHHFYDNFEQICTL